LLLLLLLATVLVARNRIAADPLWIRLKISITSMPRHVHISLRKYRFPWRNLIRPPPVHPKRHLNRFIPFAGLTLVTNRQKDIQRDHATCVTTGRISWLCIVMRPNDQCWMTSFTVWEHIAAGYITYVAFLCNLSLSECNYSRAWFWHCWTMVANFSNAGAKQ